MSIDLQQLVEKIVKRVMQQVEADPDLAPLFHHKQVPKKESWARTCSSYRDDKSDRTPTPETPNVAPSAKKLYTESDVLELAKAGQTTLLVQKKTIITPAARDAAKLKGLLITVINR